MDNFIEIEPMGYVRRTRADAWKKRPVVMRYYAYLDELRLKLNPFKLADSYEIQFGIAIPPSYSKKKRCELLGKPHQTKPDLDNLIKGVQDGMRKEENDSRIHRFAATKVWSEKGFIKVKNT